MMRAEFQSVERAMNEKAAERAAMWDARYEPGSYAYGEAANAFLVAQAPRLKRGMRALVPGDGEGRNGVWLAEQGLSVDTLDLSAKGVAKARRLAAARGVSVNAAQADVLAWAWPREAYDVVALIYLHFAADERRFVHGRALAALKPGGLLILEAFRPEQLAARAAGARGGPREAHLLYSLADLSADFAGHDIVELAEASAVLEEGALHIGASEVVRAVVRRV
jgi:2-polyprenyl-3-methyl-5-hydroxy-6-metoxy-1,4-benzoquinol methylase